MQLQDVEIERNVDTSRMRWPMREILTGQDGEGVNRLFCDLSGMPWAIVERLIEYEEPKVSAVDSREAGTDDVFERRDVDPWFGLDLGVASAVGALSAANCFPVWSCNGEPKHTESLPTILFRARVTRVPDLLEVAEEAGCGLINNFEHLELYATHVRHFIAFARALLARRSRLRPVYRRRRGGTTRRIRYPHGKQSTGQLRLW